MALYIAWLSGEVTYIDNRLGVIKLSIRNLETGWCPVCKEKHFLDSSNTTIKAYGDRIDIATFCPHCAKKVTPKIAVYLKKEDYDAFEKSGAEKPPAGIVASLTRASHWPCAVELNEEDIERKPVLGFARQCFVK
jgi:tryptophan synthase beta subunit